MHYPTGITSTKESEDRGFNSRQVTKHGDFSKHIERPCQLHHTIMVCVARITTLGLD